MIDRVICISIDIMNYDKPPASLAFLAGACEAANKEYQCHSLNFELLSGLNEQEYNNLYAELKLGNLNFFTPNVNQVLLLTIEKIKKFNADLIISSIFSYVQYPLAVKFFSLIREALPGLTILAGGPGIQNINPNGITNGKKLLEQNLIDYYCLGEGDQVVLEFVKGNRLCTGINGHNSTTETWVPQIENLDSVYLVPTYKKISLQHYHNLENKESVVFSISTSRGCVRRCTFCDVARHWPKFRFRSGKNIAQEILKHHQEVGAVHFTIVDSLINGSLKSFYDFNREIITLKQEYPGLKNFTYNGMFIVRDSHAHTEEFFRTLSEAGCESITIGVETGSDRLRFEMNKKFTNKDLDHHFEMSKKYGIKNFLLTFVGYPTETREDFEMTLDMLDRYQHYLIDNTIVGINHSGVFNMLPDTPVYDAREHQGIYIDANYGDDYVSTLQWHNHNNPGLDIRERILRDLEFRERCANLRYPVPYANRYLEYMKYLDSNFLPVAD